MLQIISLTVSVLGGSQSCHHITTLTLWWLLIFCISSVIIQGYHSTSTGGYCGQIIKMILPSWHHHAYRCIVELDLSSLLRGGAVIFQIHPAGTALLTRCWQPTPFGGSV